MTVVTWIYLAFLQAFIFAEATNIEYEDCVLECTSASIQFKTKGSAKIIPTTIPPRLPAYLPSRPPQQLSTAETFPKSPKFITTQTPQENIEKPMPKCIPEAADDWNNSSLPEVSNSSGLAGNTSMREGIGRGVLQECSPLQEENDDTGKAEKFAEEKNVKLIIQSKAGDSNTTVESEPDGGDERNATMDNSVEPVDTKVPGKTDASLKSQNETEAQSGNSSEPASKSQNSKHSKPKPKRSRRSEKHCVMSCKVRVTDPLRCYSCNDERECGQLRDAKTSTFETCKPFHACWTIYKEESVGGANGSQGSASWAHMRGCFPPISNQFQLDCAQHRSEYCLGGGAKAVCATCCNTHLCNGGVLRLHNAQYEGNSAGSNHGMHGSIIMLDLFIGQTLANLLRKFVF